MNSTSSPAMSDVSALTPHQRWATEITYAEKELKKFHDRARKVVRRFVDERDAVNQDQKWFNLFHANTKILSSALYAQLPQPEVKRKFMDYQDDIARVAANILQRCITPDIDDPRDTFDAVMRQVVFDRLVPGLATVWVRLETDTEEVELQLESSPSIGESREYPEDHHNYPLNSGFETGAAPDEAQAQTAAQPQPPAQEGAQQQQQQQQPVEPETYTRITDQRVAIDYVHWEDFLWSPCRVWEERRWVARRVYLDRATLRKRFPDHGDQVPLNFRVTSPASTRFPSDITPTNNAVEMAEIYEIWDRMERKVYWYCKDYPQMLEERDDFLQLIGFEPCPKPFMANVTTSNTVPRPDYYLVQDQYGELDTLNNRINMLASAVKAVGVYDKSADGVQRLFQEGTDNTLIPVDNWAMFAEKGGLKGQIDWLPLDAIVTALARLMESREATKQQIYELTGIADIVRGASKASETLGAQQLKAQFASIRIKDLQDGLAAFASEVLRLKAEVMAKHFTGDILKRKSNILRTDDAVLADMAIQLLKSEEGFEWRIQVSSDQLAQADYAMQKQERMELLTTVGQYISQIRDVAMAVPAMGPMFVTMLKWAVAGFRGAREIEGFLDRELDKMIQQQAQAQQQAQQQQQGPSPEEQKMQAEMQMRQQDHQMNQQSKQLDLQNKMQAQQADLQFKKASQQLDIQKKVADLQFDQMSKGIFQ